MTAAPQIPGTPAPTWSQPPPPAQHRFGALAWSAVILGIIGVVGSPIIILNNLTAVVAVVGLILGAISLFGTRKVLAGIGVVLCIAAVAFTVAAQGAAVNDLNTTFTDPAVKDGAPPAVQDVRVSDCRVVDNGYGSTSTQSVITIHNSTKTTQSYMVTVSVNNESGTRVGEINAVSNSLAAGQSVTLSGMDASGLAPQGAQPGPAQCTVASVDRFAG